MPQSTPRRAVQPRVEPLESRLALAATVQVDDALIVPATIPVGASASGLAVRLLAGVYTFAPLATASQRPPGPLLVGPADLTHRRVLDLLKRAYESGESVALARTGPNAVRYLANALGAPDLAQSDQGAGRAELVAFRKIDQGGRSLFSASVLLPRSPTRAEPPATRAERRGADLVARNFVIDAFAARAPLDAPSTGGDPPDLLDLANAYQTSLLKHDGKGRATQVVNTIYSARSFTNRKDLYYVSQEVSVQALPGAPSSRVTALNDLISLQGSPTTLQPGPQSTSNTTTITNEISQTLGGSVGYTQGEGFNASINASITITDSRTVTVPPVAIDYQGDLASGDTLWYYTATSGQGIRTTTFVNQWLWQVPFEKYTPGATTIRFYVYAANEFTANGGPDAVIASFDSVVPTPFGSTFELGHPAVTRVSEPTVSPGSTFTIDGQALYPGLVEAVLIGGQALPAANFEPVSDTRIQVVAPNTPGASLPVVVKTSQGFSNSDVTISILG